LLSELAERAESAAQRERELRKHLHEAHFQLAERDDQIARLVDPRRPTSDEVLKLQQEREILVATEAALRADCDQLSADLTAARAALECCAKQLAVSRARLTAMASTRAWRIAGTWCGARGLREPGGDRSPTMRLGLFGCV
jgi:chromosome segregation ATPase